MAGRVRSSDVGPSPPVVITAPVRATASRTAAEIAAAPSPTVVRLTTEMPTAPSSRASQTALMSIVSPSRSSSPMVTISTTIFGRWEMGDGRLEGPADPHQGAAEVVAGRLLRVRSRGCPGEARGSARRRTFGIGGQGHLAHHRTIVPDVDPHRVHGQGDGENHRNRADDAVEQRERVPGGSTPPVLHR